MLFSQSSLLVAIVCAIIFACMQAYKHSSSSMPYIVHDEVRLIKPSNQHGTLTVATSVPDWKAVDTDGRIRYIETLLIADSEVSRFYGRDMRKLRRAVTSLMQALDLYLYQIDLRMIVVDVMEMNVHNATLEYLANYRSEKFAELPEHDLIILISNAYEGGIAYVNGICSRSAVGIIGFFADAPMEYAAIFFHELAHLLGLSHDAIVACACNSIDSDEGCLKIDGFDYDCSVQALVDKLPQHICIQSPPQSVPRSALPVCGNQIIEQHEECDCGPERFCKSMICDAATCTRTISDLQILTVLTVLTSAISLLLYCVRTCRQPKKPQVYAQTHLNPTKKVWDTPTFMPLVSSLSDSRAPIWNASMLSDDSSNFTTPQTSPVKLLASPTTSTPKRDSYLPPVPPRLVNYVNITHAKSAENIVQASKVSPSATLRTKIQTLDRNTKRMTSASHQQSLLLAHSPLNAHSTIPKSLKPKYALYCESDIRIVARPTETKSASLNRTHLAPRRLIFSTDSSQEISTQSTPTTEHINTHPTPLDEYIQVPKTPEKERQHRELINALSQCLLLEDGNNHSPLQPKKLYRMPPVDHNADDTHCQLTKLSSSETVDDIPTPQEHTATLITSKSNDHSNDHFVKLSFKQPTCQKNLSSHRRCHRSRSFNKTPTASSIEKNRDEKPTDITNHSEMIDPREQIRCTSINRRPKIPPPPPPLPPHAGETAASSENR